jgi:hypothetical protein
MVLVPISLNESVTFKIFFIRQPPFRKYIQEVPSRVKGGNPFRDKPTLIPGSILDDPVKSLQSLENGTAS